MPQGGSFLLYEGKAGDDFWVKAETLLYTALIGYIYYEAPANEQNFALLCRLWRQDVCPPHQQWQADFSIYLFQLYQNSVWDTILYNHLLMSEKLYPHLLEIDRTAQERVDTMLPHMMETAGVTEELKACVPIGIEEAARIDGANKLQVFIRIVLPLVSPGIVATAIYVFINAWNEYLYSMILMSSSDKTTISVAVKTLEGADILNWGSLMAACAIVVVPSIIFFCFIQNKMAGGLSDGAVK